MFVQKAITLPQGFKSEVYKNRRGKISFSSPLTSSTWTNDPDKIGEIQSLSIGDVEGFYERSDGKVEEYNPYSNTKGEFYDHCDIISRREAINRITQVAEDDDWYDFSGE